MAEEAFALSPISARAAQPSEEDYAAISQAFMETSRGRWFLGEYAKRNRNADTRMVLDAVARIEESLAAQRLSAAEAFRDEQLEQALNALRGAVEAVQASAVAALDDLGFEQRLAPLRRGVRVIREISWRLREIGNDGRICDIMDSQAGAIEASAAQLSLDDAKTVLDNAFATLARRLAGFSMDEATQLEADAPQATAPIAEAAVAERPAAPPSPVPSVAVAETMLAQEEAPAAPSAEASAATTLRADDAALAAAEAALAEAEAAELAHVADEAAADAHDEAVLDLIAMEMGAPDPIDDEMIAEETRIAAAMAAEPETASQPEPVAEVAPQAADIARVPEPVASIEPPVETPVAAAPASEPAPQPDPAATPEPPIEVSLGSTIIANGLVKKPSPAANDPLAPIRRMSQAEKIALFS
ncbi:hypothetical protein JQ615_35005 [Bradyrhizobium jicamae]|uniref:Chemotaxis protein CheZ n=1 Tax=Bradyrhizobium jicamae TaxID=280332 RepID=A0ABS5FUT8_9BRAD|nr:hypothetical protein [Bradyrhizobium jicamae]MBR0800586.1 hypothetical protein [Bradyrhizobium jicamae]MBR0938348.1 hypothetical protein [Bradyrhizobium jicamae]